MKEAGELYMDVQERECPRVNNLTLPEEWQIIAMKEYAEQFNPKWIYVEDDLPENFRLVLVFADFIGKTHMAEINTVGCYQKDHWTTDRDQDWDFESITVRKWMYIPN